MTEILTFTAAEADPDLAEVMANQGIPASRLPPDPTPVCDCSVSSASTDRTPIRTALPETIRNLYLAARGLFAETARPIGILAGIPLRDFETIHRGDGRNEPATPVGDIFHRADHLALYAATVGQRVSERITDCFRSRDFALGAMLDAMASAAADKLGELIESRFLRMLSDKGQVSPGTRALRYSPGYCGWHISGQRSLFDFLRPENIGILLTESFLMQPLKSVSGVIIVGQEGIHAFQDVYPFCAKCRTHGCRERIRSLAAH
ncbi:MAG TPA: vitamin B12 dependent-methionine synthase activation domain-containing protein [Phycisphaerae bacterium]|nr:vitamin B12 dependent-methionine synthase activation domain-containing protein [Phycisphaerae bacterium]